MSTLKFFWDNRIPYRTESLKVYTFRAYGLSSYAIAKPGES